MNVGFFKDVFFYPSRLTYFSSKVEVILIEERTLENTGFCKGYSFSNWPVFAAADFFFAITGFARFE